MGGKYGIADVANDAQRTRDNMMELWNESMRQSRVKRETPVQVAERSESEVKADLEQRIRNGQAPCPTCASRTYKDGSDDTSVSFQAPKHIAAAVSGLAVMSHEREHVNHNDAEAQEKGGNVQSSSVMLEYAKCPECGRTYVAGGVTSTVMQTPTEKGKQADLFRRFDVSV